MFCKAKSAKKQTFFCAAILDHFKTKMFKCSNIGHRTSGSGGKKTVKRTDDTTVGWTKKTRKPKKFENGNLILYFFIFFFE